MNKASGSQDEAAEADRARAVAGPSAGQRLREAREASGQQVEEAAVALHLMPAQIRALEADDYAKFPAPIFVSGYVRKYAAHLNLDPAPLLAALEQAGLRTPPIRSELTASFPAPAPPGLPREARTAVAVIAGIVILAAVWYLLMRPPGEIDVPAPDGAPVPGIVPPETATPTPATPAPGEAPLSTGPSVLPAPTVPEGPMDQLVMSFSGSSWVEVVDVTGRRLAYRMGVDGEVLSLRGLAPFDILLGNAPNVAIDYNGAPYRNFPVNRHKVASFTLGRPGEAPGPGLDQ